MNKSGPIIVIEDDRDDQEMLDEIFKELNFKNKIIYFEDGELALDYLIKTEYVVDAYSKSVQGFL